MQDRLNIQELGRPAAALQSAPSQDIDLQDVLLFAGIISAETAGIVIWWPSAFILAAIFCFGFAYMIERTKRGSART